MFTNDILAGSTDVSVVIRIIDSTDGTPETGVVWNTSGIDLEYRRELSASVDITEATLAALTTAHSDGGFLHIGNGYYRLDLPDAACAAGARGVLVHGTVTGMIVIGCYVNLTPVPVDIRQYLGTAVPTPTVAGVPEVDVTHWNGTAVATPTVAGVPEVDMTHLGGVAQSATDLKDFADDGYDPSTNKVQGVVLTDTVTTATTVTTVNGLAANSVTASALAADAAGEIADAVWDEDATGHQTQGTFGQAIGDPVADTDTIWGLVNTNLDAAVSTRATPAQVNTEADTALSDVGLTTTVTGRIDAAVTTRATPAQVNTEVLDVVTVDTFAEVSAVPAATSTLKDKINWLFVLARNRLTQTASTQTLRNDANSADIATAAVADDGTTASRAEWT